MKPYVGTISGRMSWRRPNMQNAPKKGRYEPKFGTGDRVLMDGESTGTIRGRDPFWQGRGYCYMLQLDDGTLPLCTEDRLAPISSLQELARVELDP